jgi:hypothetical protein
MDTNVKTCFLCEKEFDNLIGVDTEPVCDDCIELLCRKISNRYKDELYKALTGLKITSKVDFTYFFGSVNFFMNKPFFIPVIIYKADKVTIQFTNKEEDRNDIIEKIL